MKNAQHNFLIASLLFTTVMIVFFPLFSAGFLAWDDFAYISHNRYVNSISTANIKVYFTQSFLGNYHPLTMCFYAFDYALGNGKPFVFHLTNIILHALNAFILYIIINCLLNNKFIALFTAALFAIHPLSVESVGWIAELKNVLYTFFFFISTLFYIHYLNKGSKKYYWLSLFFFVASLLSKGQAVALPLTLIAVVWVVKKKFFYREMMVELLPYFLLSFIFGIVAINVQNSDGYVNTLLNISLQDKITVACYGYTQYILKIIFPYNLSAFYPYPKAIETEMYIYVLPVVFIVWLFVYAIQKKIVGIAAAILVFTSNIIFVLQFIPLGAIIIADRYTYIPSIALFVCISSLVNNIIIKHTNFKTVFYALLIIVIVTLSTLTYKRCTVWKTNETFLQAILNQFPTNEIVLNSICSEMINKGDYATAHMYINKALDIDPKYFQACYNKGKIYYKQNEHEKALEWFNKCLAIENDYYDALYARAIIYKDKKEYLLAISDLNKSIELNKNFDQAYYLRGLCYDLTGKTKEAINDYFFSIKLGYDENIVYMRIKG